MHNTDPFPLSPKEWDDIAAIRDVRENWGLDTNENGLALADRAYGARFNFVSGMPGYCGDLYVVSGDALSAPPMMLIRRDGHLLAVTDF
jgi:hypothetical protein